MDARPLLIFLEDPGAANFLGPVAEEMDNSSDSVHLFAQGLGAAQLDAMEVGHEVPGWVDAHAAVSQLAPWGVLVGSSENLDTMAFDLIDAARQHGLPSIGGVDGPANAEMRFRGRGQEALRHAPDWLLFADRMTQEGFVSLGFAEDRTIICGHPYYDKVRERGDVLAREGLDTVRRRVTLAAERPVVVFLSEISGGLNPSQYEKSADYTLSGRGKSVGRTEIVIEEFLEAVDCLPERPYLVLRLHPKNDDTQLRPYYEEFDQVSRGGRALDVVFAADLVVGMTTSLLVEAALLGRATLSILPRTLERQWLLTTATGETPTAYRREDIVNGLTDGLSRCKPRSIDSLLPPGATRRAIRALSRIRCQERSR